MHNATYNNKQINSLKPCDMYTSCEKPGKKIKKKLN